MTISSYKLSGIFFTRLIAIILTLEACKGGKERRIFVGLGGLRQHPSHTNKRINLPWASQDGVPNHDKLSNNAQHIEMRSV